MLSKQYNNYFFLKDHKILAPVIASNAKKARKQLITQHSFVNVTGKENLKRIILWLYNLKRKMNI